MRILVVAARAPAAHAKGDQVRPAQFLPALCGQHHGTLVCPAPKRIARVASDQRWASLPVRLTLVERVAGAAAAWLRGRPAQTGWCAPRRFRSVVRRAALSCDVTLFITVRPYTEVLSVSVVDHVDALSLKRRQAGHRREVAGRAPVVAPGERPAGRLGARDRRSGGGTAGHLGGRRGMPAGAAGARGGGNAAAALPITPAALRVLRAKGYTGPAEIIPLGVDLTRFRPRPAPPRGRFTVGFIGRLEPHKGLTDLLAAAERLDCGLLLVGDGSQRALLEREAARRPGRLELVPWVERGSPFRPGTSPHWRTRRPGCATTPIRWQI